MGKLKIVFLGSPVFAVPSLRALAGAGHEITAVYTQMPRPAGRGNLRQQTAIHDAALEMGLTVRHPEKLRGADLDDLMATDADVLCVVGYGLLLSKVVVDGRVCVNVHPSALPRWRGATPVQSALMAGDATTDVCIMRLDEGMDTGPVYDRTPVAIGPDMTAGELNDVVWEIGAKRLVWVVEHLHDLTAVPQQGEATAAPKIDNAMRVIDWRRDAATVHNLVRALSPLPGATAEVGGERVKILRSEVADATGAPGEIVAVDGKGLVVACGQGAVRLLTVQRPGGKALSASDVARGWPALAAGGRFVCA